MPLPGYGKIWHFGREESQGITEGSCTVQEKVDGSQFSFMKTESGELVFRSKSAPVDSHNPGMFSKAVEALTGITDRIVPGIVFRGEYLRVPKHNTLAYKRTPFLHVILFDATRLNPMSPLPLHELRALATAMEMEVVPTLYEGEGLNLGVIKQLLKAESVLGGQQIEGVVVKNYSKYCPMTAERPLMAKYVRESFKELHSKEWKKQFPTQTDIVNQLVAEYGSFARWDKAVNHMRDLGTLENDPRDIGPLLKEVQKDLLEEYAGEIKQKLWKHFRKQIMRGVINGFPEWYKGKLLERALEAQESATGSRDNSPNL